MTATNRNRSRHPPKVADIGGKRLVSLAPTAWVQGLQGRADVVAQEVLGSEFQWVGRQGDIAIRIYSPLLGTFLLLLELQLRYGSEMPVRVHAYAA